MSYFTITEGYMTESVNKVRDHSGCRNPHYNKPHSDASKRAISATQKARYDLLRTAVAQSKNQITEERVREIIQETIKEYLAKNAKPVDNNKKINITL